MLLELKRFNIPLGHKVFLEDVTWQEVETILEELGGWSRNSATLTSQQHSRPRKRETHNIIIGQKVTSVKVQRAKELRHKMTQEEKILWQHLRANQLNGLHFRRQQIIDGFIADFYCHAAELVIEVDVGIHQQQAEYDAERDRVLLARGLRLLRIKNEEVRQNLNSVLMRISQVCCEET